jgi:hypothetical protein
MDDNKAGEVFEYGLKVRQVRISSHIRTTLPISMKIQRMRRPRLMSLGDLVSRSHPRKRSLSSKGRLSSKRRLSLPMLSTVLSATVRMKKSTLDGERDG